MIFKKKEFIFHVADNAVIDKLRDEILDDNVKVDIVDRLHAIRSRLKSMSVRYVNASDNPVNPPETVTNVFGPGAIRTFYAADKFSLATALAYYMADDRNLTDGEVVSDDSVKELVNEIALHGTASLNQVKRLCGKSCITVKGPSWDRKTVLTGKLHHFKVWSKRSEYFLLDDPDQQYVRMPRSMAEEAILKAYPPEPDHLAALPETGTDFMVVDRQKEVGSLLTVFGALNNSGALSGGVTKLLTKTDCKRIFKQTGDDKVSAEVAEATFTRPWEDEVSLRTLPLAAAFFVNELTALICSSRRRTADDDSAEPVDLVRRFVENISKCDAYIQIIKMFLPGVDGLTASIVRYMAFSQFLEIIVNKLKESPAEAWCSVENFIVKVYVEAAKKALELMVYSDDGWPSLSYNYGTRSFVITPDNALHHLTFMFVRGVLFFLTALGVVDTAIDRNPMQSKEPFMSMRWFRLTPLGLYALGCGPRVDLTAANGYAFRYELVDDPLIIVALDTDNPYNLWLDRIGTRRGNRWIVTPASFLNDCNSRADVKKAVEEFRKYICRKPSAVWNGFFDRMIRNAGENTLQHPCVQYTMYEVNPENSELLAFLSTDPEVRTMYFRAEGYRIILPLAKMPYFVKAMRRGGFLISL